MTVIEYLRRYLNTYPPLADGRINVDFLPQKARSYSIDAVPCNPVVKRYVDGSSIRQFLFTLSSRETYGEQIIQQLDNLGFYEDFSRWIYEQNIDGIFPDMGNGRYAQSISVVTNGYAFIPESKTARYQIQCNFTYLQEKE